MESKKVDLEDVIIAIDTVAERISKCETWQEEIYNAISELYQLLNERLPNGGESS